MGELREIQSRVNGSAARRVNRVGIVAGHRVRAQRQPVSDEGQLVGEIESPHAMAGIIIWTVIHGTRISYIAVPNCPERHGTSIAAKFGRAAESKLEILRRLKGDFFPV